MSKAKACWLWGASDMRNGSPCIVLLVILVSGLLESRAVGDGDAAEAAPPGDLTLHVIPQSHIDLAWWWRYDPETVDIVAEHTLETAFANLEKFPEYTFTYLQGPAIEPLETRNPKLFYRLRYYAHQVKAMKAKPGSGKSPASKVKKPKLAPGEDSPAMTSMKSAWLVFLATYRQGTPTERQRMIQWARDSRKWPPAMNAVDLERFDEGRVLSITPREVSTGCA